MVASLLDLLCLFFSLDLLLPSWERLCNFVALSNEIRARPMLEKKYSTVLSPCWPTARRELLPRSGGASLGSGGPWPPWPMKIPTT